MGSTTTSGSGMMVPKNQLKKRGVSRISRQRIYSVKNSHSGNHSESKTSQFRHIFIFMTLNIPCKKWLVGEYGPARKPGHTEESRVKPGAGQDCNTVSSHPLFIWMGQEGTVSGGNVAMGQQNLSL